MSKALSLFGYLDILEAIYEPDDLTNSEAIQAVFKCTAYDADNFLELQKYETGKGNSETGNGETWSAPDFTRANFMNCFQFLQESDEGNDCLPYRSKNIDLSTLSFLQRLAFAGNNSYFFNFPTDFWNVIVSRGGKIGGKVGIITLGM